MRYTCTVNQYMHAIAYTGSVHRLIELPFVPTAGMRIVIDDIVHKVERSDYNYNHQEFWVTFVKMEMSDYKWLSLVKRFAENGWDMTGISPIYYDPSYSRVLNPTED